MCRSPFLNNITSTDVRTICKPDGENVCSPTSNRLIIETVTSSRPESTWSAPNHISTWWENSVNGPCIVNNTDWRWAVSWPWSSELLHTLSRQHNFQNHQNRQKIGHVPALHRCWLHRNYVRLHPPRLFYNNWYFACGSFISCHHFHTLLVKHRPHDLRIVSSLATRFAHEDITIPLNWRWWHSKEVRPTIVRGLALQSWV